MRILAIDTAMAACSVAVSDDEVVIASAFEPMERGHAEALATMVQLVVQQSGLAFSGLDRIAVTTGPGTFTGVRIGLAMARGLGLALGIPVVGIDTLTAIACNDLTAVLPPPLPREGGGEGRARGRLQRSEEADIFSAEPPPHPNPLPHICGREGEKSILVTADARKGEVYAALFEDGRLIRLPHVISTSLAASDVPSGTVVMGTAAQAVIEESGRNDLVRSSAGDVPVAAHFAALAARLPSPDGMPAPLYLRAPDAKPQTSALRRVVPVIVSASLESTELLASMHAECFNEPWTPHAFADLLAMPGATAAIAMEHDEPLGFVLMRQAADEAEIITIATRPMAQRRGVARALLNHQFTERLRSGVRHVFIEVAQSNAAAHALYASLGFAQAGLRRGYYERGQGKREDAIVMRKDLAS